MLDNDQYQFEASVYNWREKNGTM